MKITITDDCKGHMEVHGATCAHMKRQLREDFFTHEVYSAEFATKHEVWEDHNLDFIEEGEEAGTWELIFYPCTEMVSKKEHYNGV